VETVFDPWSRRKKVKEKESVKQVFHKGVCRRCVKEAELIYKVFRHRDLGGTEHWYRYCRECMKQMIGVE